MHKRENLVNLEHLLIAGDQSIESLHVTLLDKVHDLIVWEQVLLEILLVKDLSVWDFSHQKLHDDKQLLSVDAETNCADLRCLSETLDQ